MRYMRCRRREPDRRIFLWGQPILNADGPSGQQMNVRLTRLDQPMTWETCRPAILVDEPRFSAISCFSGFAPQLA